MYFGRRFKPYVRQGYMSGGAGYVMSREALDRLVQRAMHDPQQCLRDGTSINQSIYYIEDVEIGQCLQSVDVLAGDSRDEHGKHRFHPFPPSTILVRGRLPRDLWYWDYNYYPAGEVCL